MKRYAYYVFMVVAAALCSCSGPLKKERVISVTIEPQRYFVEQIAGGKFSVHCVVPAGQSPETFDPSPRQMAEIGRSTAYFRIGYIGFEQAWMENIQENNPDMPLFDLSKGMTLIHGSEEMEETEHRMAGGSHTHLIDPHIWSSFEGARTIARNTLDALITIDEENSSYYRTNYNKLCAVIDSTEAEADKLLKPLLSRTFIIYHPSLTYFAKEYGLTQLCIEFDGKEPSPSQMKELIDTARKHNVRVVFVQQEFDSKNAALVAEETGCRLVVINPLAYDWPGEMLHIAKSLAEGL